MCNKSVLNKIVKFLPANALTSQATSPDPELAGVLQVKDVAVTSLLGTQTSSQIVTTVEESNPRPVTAMFCPPARLPVMKK